MEFTPPFFSCQHPISSARLKSFFIVATPSNTNECMRTSKSPERVAEENLQSARKGVWKGQIWKIWKKQFSLTWVASKALFYHIEKTVCVLPEGSEVSPVPWRLTRRGSATERPHGKRPKSTGSKMTRHNVLQPRWSPPTAGCGCVRVTHTLTEEVALACKTSRHMFMV